MEVYNPLYKNQGIHVITSIFTVEKGVVKVLLIKRKNEPYKNMWALVGGALYNNEDLIDGVSREIYEKTGLKDVDIYFSGVFGKVDRSPVMRMVAITYIGVIDSSKVSLLDNKLNCDWFNINNIPSLAYDHKEILGEALECLKKKIINSDILKALFPNGFTIPEMQKTYETILNTTFDRRNFRKKLLSNDFIEPTGRSIKFEGNKPAELYCFKASGNDKNVF